MKAKPQGTANVGAKEVSEPDSGTLTAGQGSAQQAEGSGPGQDRLNERILRVFQQKVERMVDDAAKNPKSDAGEMVRILVLSKLLGMHNAIDQESVRDLLKEERARDKQQKDLARENLKLKRQVQAAKDRVRNTKKEMEEARRKGKPLTDSEIYNRIASVVGLRVPKQETVASDK